MKKSLRNIMTALFGLAALAALMLHLTHWWTMRSAIAQWNAALTERVIAHARQDELREELQQLRAKLTNCQEALAVQHGNSDLDRRIAKKLAELEAAESAESSIDTKSGTEASAKSRVAAGDGVLEAAESAESSIDTKSGTEASAKSSTGDGAEAVERRFRESVAAVQRLLASSADKPESVKIQQWGAFIKNADNTYLLPCQWVWEDKAGKESLQRKIFRLDMHGKIIGIIDF